ncbi:MAG: hypothetical protein JNJ78_21465 [Anaerolineae bacterium]|nr:hypothetical protein [Anaerolineae bacterium]
MERPHLQAGGGGVFIWKPAQDAAGRPVLAAAVIDGGKTLGWRALMSFDGGKMGKSRFWLREARSWLSPHRQSCHMGGCERGIR